MAITVKWLGNNGVRVVRKLAMGRKVERFVRPNETLSVVEAAAALSTNDMRIYRLERQKLIRLKIINGEKRVPLAEVKRFKRNPRLLYPSLEA